MQAGAISHRFIYLKDDTLRAMLSRHDLGAMEMSGLPANGQSALESNDPEKKLTETADRFEAYKFAMGVDAKTFRDEVRQYRGECGRLGT